MRYELIVFDWDGTLIDSAGAIVASMQAACRDLGLPEPSRERASHVIGLGLRDSLAYVAPDLPESGYARMVERYRFHFLSRDAGLPLFDGAREMLEELESRGHVLAIATGKSDAGLQRALEQTGIGRHFAATRCADRTAPKPAPDMLRELMDELAGARESTLMVGDTTHDLEMAANAGVSAVAVAYGAHPREKLRPFAPLAVVDRPEELRRWLGLNA